MAPFIQTFILTQVYIAMHGILRFLHDEHALLANCATFKMSAKPDGSPLVSNFTIYNSKESNHILFVVLKLYTNWFVALRLSILSFTSPMPSSRHMFARYALLGISDTCYFMSYEDQFNTFLSLEL